MDIQAKPIIEAFRSFRDPSKAFVLGVAVLNGRLIRFGVEIDAPLDSSRADVEGKVRPLLDEWWASALEDEDRHERGECGGSRHCTTCMAAGGSKVD